MTALSYCGDGNSDDCWQKHDEVNLTVTVKKSENKIKVDCLHSEEEEENASNA